MLKLRHEGVDVEPNGVMVLRKRGLIFVICLICVSGIVNAIQCVSMSSNRYLSTIDSSALNRTLWQVQIH